MMKKLVSLLIVLLMIVSVTAGAEENGSAVNEAEAVQTETVQDEAAPEAGQAENAEPETTEAPAGTGTGDGTEISEVSEAAETPDATEGEEIIEPNSETESSSETEAAGLTGTELTGEAPETVAEETQEDETAAETEEAPAAEPEAVPADEAEAAPADEAEVTPADEAEAAPAVETESAPEAEAEAAPAAETEAVPAAETEAAPTAEPEAPAAEPQGAEGQPTADVLSATAYAEGPEAPADVLTTADSIADVLPMSSYANENSIRGFVYRLYSTVFQRTPDEAGLRYWVNKLETGENTAADVVSFFFNSPEYQRSGKNNAQIVTDCYNTMLNRAPEESGFQYWKQRLDIGMTPQTVLVGFVYSPEFAGIVEKYGVVRGDMTVTNPRDKNYERTYFVYRLYSNCLSRGADLAGEEYWCDQLDKGLSGAEVASGFFFSDEFNKNRYNNSTFVQLLYKAIQGREYDTDGLVHWTTRLNLYDTREKVLNGFILSPEFHAQCAVAQINAGDPLPTPDDSIEWQYNIRVLRLCNAERQKAGMANLYTREDLLWDLAIQRAGETTELFSHTRPDGSDCFTLFKEQGFYGYLGENLAAGDVFRDPVEVVEAWMNSEGHRKNILNPNFTYLATGYVYDPYAYSYCAEGKYSGTYQQFGSYAAQSFCNYGIKID